MALELTLGLLGVLIVGIMLFKLRVPAVSFTWGILSIGIAASVIFNEEVSFTPYLQIAVMAIGVLLAWYSVAVARGQL